MPAAVDDRDRSALRTVQIDGETFVPDSEITRLLELAATPPTSAEVLAGGDDDDLLSVTEAAELLGVSAQYVRRLCARTAEPDDSGEDEPRLARLAAVKHDGVFVIRRDDLAEFAGQRKPPVARVGYDLTLTVGKVIRAWSCCWPPSRSAGDSSPPSTWPTRRRSTISTGTPPSPDAAARSSRPKASSAPPTSMRTSRALDPHPHRHNVIANAVVDDEGDIRALDARALYRAGPAAAALATAAARWELRDLGLGWWQRDDGIWEIAGVDEAAIEEFSSRHRKIGEIKAALARQLGRPVTRPEDARIWADTRADKTAVDPTELQKSWRRSGRSGRLRRRRLLRSARSGDRLRHPSARSGRRPVRRPGRPRARTVRRRRPLRPRRRHRRDRRLVSGATSTARAARCCYQSPRSNRSPTVSSPTTT